MENLFSTEIIFHQKEQYDFRHQWKSFSITNISTLTLIHLLQTRYTAGKEVERGAAAHCGGIQSKHT